MQIQGLKVKKRKNRKRIARGGKRGTYSGKGNKGQKARSGSNKTPLFEGGRSSLIDRLKKIGGFKSRNVKNFSIKLEDIEKKFKNGEIVSSESLSKVGLIRKTKKNAKIKILGNFKITKKVTIEKGLLISQKAQELVEKAGGKVEKEEKVKKENKKEVKIKK